MITIGSSKTPLRLCEISLVDLKPDEPLYTATLRSDGGAGLEFCGPERDARVTNKLKVARSQPRVTALTEAAAASGR